uniref:Uncharacterized protein n=1 Tax=Acrobeloides nanus TaxID=290746 RepID=A0A914CTK5_9BILA
MTQSSQENDYSTHEILSQSSQVDSTETEEEEPEVDLPENEIPKYAFVEVAELEKLLERCLKCGKKPRGNATGIARQITG